MQFTKIELYLIFGACIVTAGRLQLDKIGNPKAFLDVADKANGLIAEMEKAEERF